MTYVCYIVCSMIAYKLKSCPGIIPMLKHYVIGKYIYISPFTDHLELTYLKPNDLLKDG
jgi:hypothetical protein